jgi:hypothetical protein
LGRGDVLGGGIRETIVKAATSAMAMRVITMIMALRCQMTVKRLRREISSSGGV